MKFVDFNMAADQVNGGADRRMVVNLDHVACVYLIPSNVPLYQYPANLKFERLYRITLSNGDKVVIGLALNDVHVFDQIFDCEFVV